MLSQQTPEWHQRRKKGIGSSDIAAIMGKCPYRTAYQVWRSKVSDEKQPDNYAMARGREWEPVARAVAEEFFNKKFPEAFFEKGILIASLDGDSGEEILEIKIPGREVMESVKNGVVPEHYMLQVQHQLWVSDRQEAIFFCYIPETREAAFVTVEADPEIQADIVMAAQEFWIHVESNYPPELVEGDYLESTDEGFKQEVEAYIKAKTTLEEAEAEVERIKTLLKARLGSLPGMRGYGLTMSNGARKGNVDYAKIPQLKGVDLEPFRKKPIQVFTIRST